MQKITSVCKHGFLSMREQLESDTRRFDFGHLFSLDLDPPIKGIVHHLLFGIDK